MSTISADDLFDDCSDEEIYKADSTFSKMDGKIDWKPNPTRIAELYRQIESNGTIDLKWINPGRRSPSDHSSSQNVDIKTESDETKPSETNAFDFDESDIFDTDHSNKVLAATRKKSGSSSTKKVAKLDKVIGDMKKYQIIDQLKVEPKVEEQPKEVQPQEVSDPVTTPQEQQQQQQM